MYSIAVSCPRGLEELLQDEVQAISGAVAQSYLGYVKLKGDLATIYRLNLHSRLASRVLILLISGNIASEKDIYHLASRVDWSRWFDQHKTFKVHVEGRASWCQRFDFLALKIKDAICDVFRAKTGCRPNVDKSAATIRILGYINQNEAQLYIDSSGEALFKRGWRKNTLLAPIRENLAAGLLKLAGYNGQQPLIDPMCGSGTIAIEAAMIASGTAPGLYRHFAFEQFCHFNPYLWHDIQSKAQQQIIVPSVSIEASDYQSHVVKTAIANAKNVGLAGIINFSCKPFSDIHPSANYGQLICNPPYGRRMDKRLQLQSQYRLWSTILKERFPGWLAGFITPDFNFPRLLHLLPKRKIPLYNGRIECRFYLFDIVAGSNRKS